MNEVLSLLDLDRMAKKLPFVEFNSARGCFDIVTNSLRNYEISLIYKEIIRPLRFFMVPDGVFKYPKIKDINFGYPVNCYEMYCNQRLDEGVAHKETCLYKIVEKNHVLERLEGDDLNLFDPKKYLMNIGDSKDDLLQEIYKLSIKERISAHNITLDDDGWVHCNARVNIHSQEIKKRFEQKVKYILKGYFLKPKDDRILKIVDSIRKNGWKGRVFAGSGGGVLGQNMNTSVFLPFHGKHRLAALKYLFMKGEVDGDLEVEFPVIRYKTSSWRKYRPNPFFQCQEKKFCKS